MKRTLLMLLAGVSPFPAHAQIAPTQAPAQEPDSEDEFADEEEGSIVVVGQRERGTVIGDIPPENQLNARDIRATGATSISELLEAVAPQIGSARGRGGEAPVLLLNGRRISGFRELRDIPPEAIERMDILPEEVALKYGYRADQRVVNIVLRQRFRSTVVRADAGTATEGGHGNGLVDASRLMISRERRTQINLHAEGNGALDEDERDIAARSLEPGEIDERPFRSLIGSRRLVRGSVTANRTILDDVSATLNGELEHSEGRSGLGFEGEPLLRDTASDSGHLGLVMNGDRGRWRLSLTGNADWARSVTQTDRTEELTDRARSTRTSAGLDGTASGPLFRLPAGDVGATLRVGVETLNLDASRRRNGVSSSNDLGRDRAHVAVNLDVPLLRDSVIGRLTANANVEAEQLSDFGTLTTIGAGLHWSPVDDMRFIASWTREEGAPSIQQLGDPLLETPDTPVFDFTRGETVRVIAITGGNPALTADRRTVFKLGANWKPFEKTDLRLRADYIHSTIDDLIAGFPGPSPALEEAFPKRFERDGDGNLLSVDLRPVNFEQARRQTLRWGFDFTKPLRSKRPTQSQLQQLRQRLGAPAGGPGGRRREGTAAGAAPGQRPEGGARGGGRGGGGFGGFGGGGGNRGRLQFSLTHTVNLVDEATIRSGLPELDYLNGEAVGRTGGRPRHEVQLQAGWANNGVGARLSGNWRSATEVTGGGSGDLHFDDVATLDLRLFANLGERIDLVTRHPWLIGSSVRLEVDNILNEKPSVRDTFGRAPFSYQQDLLEPLGRTVTISFRKLFLPQRFRARPRAQETTR